MTSMAVYVYVLDTKEKLRVYKPINDMKIMEYFEGHGENCRAKRPRGELQGEPMING